MIITHKDIYTNEIRKIRDTQPKGNSRRMMSLAAFYLLDMKPDRKSNRKARAYFNESGDIVCVAAYDVMPKTLETNLLAIAAIAGQDRKGYASAVLELILEESRQSGMKYFKFEVDNLEAKEWYQHRNYIFLEEQGYPMKSYTPLFGTENSDTESDWKNRVSKWVSKWEELKAKKDNNAK